MLFIYLFRFPPFASTTLQYTFTPVPQHCNRMITCTLSEISVPETWSNGSSIVCYFTVRSNKVIHVVILWSPAKFVDKTWRCAGNNYLSIIKVYLSLYSSKTHSFICWSGARHATESPAFACFHTYEPRQAASDESEHPSTTAPICFAVDLDPPLAYPKPEPSVDLKITAKVK